MSSLMQAFAERLPPPDSISPSVFGNKAAMLMHMLRSGLPVPAGFVLTTELCREFFELGERLPHGFPMLLGQGLKQVETATGLRFGASRRPLLLAVRSGAPVSMPGMMETLLNVGLCDATVAPLIRMTGNPRFVWDSYRRLIQSFAEVVHNVSSDPFNKVLREQLRIGDFSSSQELDVGALRDLTRQFLLLFETQIGVPFPQEPLQQLTAAITAVLRSWRSPRAREYRRLQGLDDAIGTAVTIQTMIFGNMGNTSGSGVAFTRDPVTGENRLYFDFLANAQGEDIVSGRHLVRGDSAQRLRLPGLDEQLRQMSRALEQLFRDAQDFEFTVQEGKLYLLQTRAAKRTSVAALRIACELVQAGLIESSTALTRLADVDLESLRITRLASLGELSALANGIAACSGVAFGPIALDARAAVRMSLEGLRPILVRHDISTDDLAGIAVSEGILTSLGGRTSHAAVVARQMNKVCIVGCRELKFESGQICRIGDAPFREREILSLDGNTGSVYAGPIDVLAERPTELLDLVNSWRAQVGNSLNSSQDIRLDDIETGDV